MAFMAIGDEEVTTCNSLTDSDSESDDDVNSFLEKMHNSLKESYVRNKELKQKISFLIQDNANLYRQNKHLKNENENLKRIELDLHAKLERKINFCDILKNEQNCLKRRMNDLGQWLQHQKQNYFQRNVKKSHFSTHQNKLNYHANDFTIYRRS